MGIQQIRLFLCTKTFKGTFRIIWDFETIGSYTTIPIGDGHALSNPKGRDLYAFWGDNLANHINHDLKKNNSGYLVNLASQEYFKAAQASKIEGEIISPTFLDEKNGKYKIISFFAKKARGYMANYLIENRIDDIDQLLQISGFWLRILKIRFYHFQTSIHPFGSKQGSCLKLNYSLESSCFCFCNLD